jgi:pimeloyl-ACP methyl ester carboxylesterase
MKWGRPGVIVVIVAAVMGAAAAVQQALTVRDRRRFPPGLLVNVDGHPTHLQVRGPDIDGPTVVLDAGMGSFSPNWHWVQVELASTVKSVAYDRAGLGWSRPSRRQRDAQTIAMELRDALREAGIEPPYVLAGHSFGGLPVRAFADLYPELTAGLVWLMPPIRISGSAGQHRMPPKSLRCRSGSSVSEQPVGGELLTALQRQLSELTAHASFETVQGASHESLISDREHARVVAKTILSVVQAARDRDRAKTIG